jgi:hypothetical protein
MLLVGGGVGLAPLMLFVYAGLELVAAGLVVSLELPGPQPVSANAAKAITAKTGIIDFIDLVFKFVSWCRCGRPKPALPPFNLLKLGHGTMVRHGVNPG